MSGLKCRFGERIGQLVADLQMVELLAIGQEIEDKDFHALTSATQSLWAAPSRFNRNPVCSIVKLGFLEGVTSDGWHSPELSRRRPRSRLDPVRGRAVLHRDARLARRRGGQGRKPEGRRTRPHLRQRPGAGGRLLLFHDLQRQQEIGHGRSEIGARPRAGQGDGRAGRRLCREFRARGDRAAGARLGGAACALSRAWSTARSRGSAMAARTRRTSPST